MNLTEEQIKAIEKEIGYTYIRDLYEGYYIFRDENEWVNYLDITFEEGNFEISFYQYYTNGGVKRFHSNLIPINTISKLIKILENK